MNGQVTHWPVLSVHQPWAWAIYDGPKRVENRGWPLDYTGPLWLHVTRRQAFDRAGQGSSLVRRAWLASGHKPGELSASSDRLPFGSVAALVTVTGCHHWIECDPCAAWGAAGQFHIELAATVRKLAEPYQIRGQQGIWYLPAEAEQACRAQLDGRAA